MPKHIDVEQLKRDTDLAAVIRDYGISLKPVGGELHGICPFHNDHDPSMTVFEKGGRQSFKCHACGAGGDVIEFVMKIESVEFPEAIRRLTGEREDEVEVRRARASNGPSGASSGGSTGASAHRVARAAREHGGEHDEAPAEGNGRPVGFAKVKQDRNPLAQGAAAWSPIVPIPEDIAARGIMSPDEDSTHTISILNPKVGRFRSYAPEMVHVYRGADGETLGYVLRCIFHDPQGKRRKLFVPVTWCEPADGSELPRWVVRFWDKPRPFYGLDRLAEARGRADYHGVLLVEGEKTADAAHRLLGPDGFAVMSFPNGGNSGEHGDWSWLADEEGPIFFWPDADPAGLKTALSVADVVARHTAIPLNIVQPPAGVEAKWDLADAEAEGWTADTVLEHIELAAETVEDFIESLGGEQGRSGRDDRSFDPAELEAELEGALAQADNASDNASGNVDPAGPAGQGPMADGNIPAGAPDAPARREGPVDFDELLRRLEETGDSALAFDTDVLEAFARLKMEEPGRAAVLKTALKERGVRITEFAGAAKEFEKRIRRQAGAEANRLSAEEDDEAQRILGIRALGFNREFYYFLSPVTGQVVTLTDRDMSRPFALQRLGKLNDWTEAFPGEQGVNWQRAGSWLMDKAHAAGIYTDTKLRGNGAWLEKNDGAERIVYNLGSHLLVDTEEVGITDYRGDYIYEAGEAMVSPPLDNPLSDEEAAEVLNICSYLRWENPIYGPLLAGWIALAPVCGALHWRPHAWVTGGTGAGKTFVLTDIVRPLILTSSQVGYEVSGSTTEPGIRRDLCYSARPVIFEESESENEGARARTQAILELARIASNQDAPPVVKAGNNGGTQRFTARSMFMFASIGVNLTMAADKNRMAVLSLKNDGLTDDERKAHFIELDRMVRETIVDDYAERLFARMIRLIPTIRRNQKIFASVGSSFFGSQRHGDQYGALLAGAWALYSSEEVTEEIAREFIADQGEGIVEIIADKDEKDDERLIEAITASFIPVETSNARYSKTLGDVIAAAMGLDGGLPADVAQATLINYGMKIDAAGEYLYVRNTHPQLAMLLRNTPWANNWNNVLKNTKGAYKPKGPVRFSSTTKPGRVLAVPLNAVVSGDGINDAAA